MGTKINFYSALLTVICLYSRVFAFDDQTMHKLITKQAMENSYLNSYLINNLGLPNGVSSKFPSDTGMAIRLWLEEGSTAEDTPMCRASNHFHNPLKYWDQAGLSSGQSIVATLIDDWCAATSSYTSKYSNVVWGTGFKSPGGDKVATNNNMSWDFARSFYYAALTSTLAAERETSFASTFQAIGQVMHLLEDMAVPAHTRNDFRSHLEFNGISSPNPVRWFGNPFEHYVKVNPGLVTSISSPVIPNPARLTDLWDTDQYDGSNPSASYSIGLAEYANANFASNYTIFTEDFDAGHHFYFPYPKRSSTEVYEVEIAPGQYRSYFRKIGDGETIEHYAVAGRLYRYLSGFPAIQRTRITLDEAVYKDYAFLLIPRAVGYSAGLLNYFFRGDIDLQEDTTSGSGYIIVNNTEEDMEGTFTIYYDKISYDNEGNRNDQRTLLWSSNTSLGTNSSGNNKSSNIYFSEPSDAAEPGKYILVFSGRLGNEQNAKVGKVVSFPNLYIMVMPVNHETREIEGKQYYYMKVTDSNNSTVTLTETTETSLPFTLLDDGAYWDTVSLSWTATTSPESLGAPLYNAGPQYFAKYRDSANNRVRFVPNETYEKEAWLAFDASYGGIKEMHYVNYVGTPFSFGMYNESPGWMEYTDSGLYAILSPMEASIQRLFSLYKTNNFNDTFVETPYLRYYDFNGANSYEIAIPKDPEAPKTSVISAYMPAGESYIKISVPKIYNSYVKPNPYWTNGASTASSGVEYYRLYPNMEPVYETEEHKCTAEDNNCGNTYKSASTVKTVFDIPYSFNSYIRIHNNDGGSYYEELYINGTHMQSSTPSTKFDTHYQILAVYKDIALIRETNYVSEGATPLPYRLETRRIYEENWNFTSKYYIYINGIRYDLTGTTDIKTRYLVPHQESASGTSPVNYLTYEPVDDITGFHIDRISISETFDGSYILISYDEYAYNNGEGLIHDLRYEQSDSDSSKYILYYGIDRSKIQNADHEGIRTGRKLLLFKGDGTFKQEIQDPIGLDKTIGSIGILN